MGYIKLPQEGLTEIHQRVWVWGQTWVLRSLSPVSAFPTCMPFFKRGYGYLRDMSFWDLEKALSYPNLVEAVILDG